MSRTKNISVLITCHNRKDKTLHSLQNLYLSTLPNNLSFDVYLVDDGSSDRTSEAVKKHFPKVIIIQGNGHLFWNRGMHLAWTTAISKQAYDYYLWLNDDTFIFKDAIEELIRCSEKTMGKAVICGILCSENDSTIITYGGKNIKGKKLIPNGELQKVELLNGNVVLIPKYVFNLLGILDPIFPHAIGDYEYGLRALKNCISIFTTTKVLGTCENHLRLPNWCMPDISLINRIKNLYSPLGSAHPYYYFIFERRHFGYFIAIKHYFSIHIRMLFPSLWKN